MNIGISTLLGAMGQQIQEILGNINTSIDRNPASESGVYLFFSFDLSNSTAFKVEYPHFWGHVVKEFYRQVLELAGAENYKGSESNETKSYCVRKLWKLIGDEVLIYVQVYKPDDLYEQVKEIAELQKKILKNVIRCLNKTDIDRNCNGCFGHCQSLEHSINSMLGIKATAWLAECYESIEAGCPNIVYRQTLDYCDMIDFLGRDIDEGFRIAHYAAKNQMILSPLLAWAIWRWAENDGDTKKIVDANFRITAFLELKGVWSGRKVPIVMYHSEFSNLTEHLAYDDTELAVYENLKNLDMSMFLSDARFQVSRLDKIFQDIYRDQENEEIYQRLCNQPDPFTTHSKPASVQEFHIACAIFNEKGKLLVHKDESRGLEFGCIKFAIGTRKTWNEICQSGYASKYSLSIQLEENPIPVATYVYDKDVSGRKRRALGLIILAKMEYAETALPSEWEAYSKEQIEKLDDLEKTVPNFRENALRCFQLQKSD